MMIDLPLDPAHVEPSAGPDPLSNPIDADPATTSEGNLCEGRGARVARTPTSSYRRVRHRSASIELLLEPGGRLRRFVVLDSEKLRVALGQPKRREIDPLHAKQEHFELRTSELWALAEHQACMSLRKLYAKLAEQSAASPAAKPRRLRTPVLGQLQAPEAAGPTVRGKLLYAGPTPDGQFCVELLEDGRRVRSVTGLDLARALQVAGARLRDTILVERSSAHEVTIREEKSGSHGEGSRSLHRGRQTFTITIEPPPETASSGELPNRSRRSAPSAS